MEKKSINKIAKHPLQTWQWGEFRKKWGNEILWTKYGLITIHHLPGTHLKIGMFIKGPKPTPQMLKELKEVARKKRLIFIKMEPSTAFSIGNSTLERVGSSREREKIIKLLKSSDCVKGKTLFTPTSFWIDLVPDEENLLKNFSPKTRYNIRLAQKKGVTIKEDNSKKAFEKYLALTRETVERQKFFAHTEKYHRLMWQFLNGDKKALEKPIAYLLAAKYKGEIVTTWILFVWKEFLYYPYGASSIRNKDVMANNLMMWEAVKFGKKMGCKVFDLWGREEGKGFTRFKEGYNPQVVEFLGTWDLVINKPAYNLYRLAEKVRWPALRLISKINKPRF